MSSTERRRFILYIAVAVIIATALGGGLFQVGAGFAARNTNGITVTGSAKTSATADNVVWTLNVSLTRPTVAEAVARVGADVEAVTQYLTGGGAESNVPQNQLQTVVSSSVTLFGLDIYKEQREVEIVERTMSGLILSNIDKASAPSLATLTRNPSRFSPISSASINDSSSSTTNTIGSSVG